MKNPSSPITTEEKLALANDIKRTFHRKSELLLPDDELYPKVINDASINRAAKKILVWLGVKPKTAAFTSAKNTDNNFPIPQDFLDNPYELAGFLALACVRKLLDKKSIAYDAELEELLIIELGLGMLIVNTIGSSNDARQKTRRILGLSPNNSHLLRYYSANEFMRRFRDYITLNELHPAPVYEHTTPWGQRLLLLPHITPKKEEPYVVSSNKQLQTVRQKIIGVIVCGILMVSLFGAVYSQRSRSLSPELQSQKEVIETLNVAHSKCQETLRTKARTYDSNDIFMDRQLDAHASRCTSIKNKHDFYVRDYNQKLAEQDLL